MKYILLTSIIFYLGLACYSQGNVKQDDLDIWTDSDLITLPLLMKGDEFYELSKFEDAVYYYRKVVEMNDSRGQYLLGYMFKTGKGVELNYEEAVKWFKKSAEQNDLDGLMALGLCYYFGNGVIQSLPEAALWYRKAAELGHYEAQFSLGVMYYFGQGVSQNEEEAIRLWKNAAKKGSDGAKDALKRLNETW